jgi:hypothetical protein
MAGNARVVLQAVARRLEEDPERVLPTLRLLADQDALPEAVDVKTVELARRLNVERLAAQRAEFRARAHPTSEVRVVLGGITRQAVALRVANNGLLAMEFGGTSYFPDWQFGPDGVLPGVNRVVAALTVAGRGVLAGDRLMRTALEEERGRTPAQLLAAGDVDGVLHYIAVAGGGS